MNAHKVIPENFVLSVNFEKFIFIEKKSDQSRLGVWRAVIGRSFFHQSEFLKVNGQQINLQNDILCIHCHHCKISTKIVQDLFSKICFPFVFL